MASLKMIFSQILLCALLAVTGINGKPPSAVVRGELASEKEFPYIVGLTVYDQHMCGGVIIDATHVLTAAHCVKLEGLTNVEDEMVVVSGTIDIRKGNQHRIKSIKVHETYSKYVGWKDDIAMITLRTPIEFNEYQKPVELPSVNTPGNIKAVASGWGDLSYPNGRVPTEMWKLNMDVITNIECRLPSTTIRASHLCAKPKVGSGLCTGDSGGPLVSDGVLVGLASFVVPCGRGYPDVFTRVYHYIDWIEEARKN